MGTRKMIKTILRFTAYTIAGITLLVVAIGVMAVISGEEAATGDGGEIMLETATPQNKPSNNSRPNATNNADDDNIADGSNSINYEVKPQLSGNKRTACEHFADYRHSYGHDRMMVANDAIANAAMEISPLQDRFLTLQSLFVESLTAGSMSITDMPDDIFAQYGPLRDELSAECFKDGTW